MAQFRKKPVIIEAEQFYPEVKPWPAGVLADASSPTAAIKNQDGARVDEVTKQLAALGIDTGMASVPAVVSKAAEEFGI